MGISLPPAVRRLLEEPNFVHLATLMPDGSPHVAPVWVDLEGDRILVNTAEGRTKLRNARRDPRVGLSAVRQSNPYEAVFIRGRVVEVRPDQEGRHIDRLAQKYLGRERYPWRAPGEQRVVMVIEPQWVGTMGL